MSLERFIKAQKGSYDKALAELKAGAKETHWMWWIFPQMGGLGSSDNAIYYGIADYAKKTIISRYFLERFGGWYSGNKMDFIYEW